MNSVLSYLAAARRSEESELENLARTCDLVLAASELVHHLQQERGSSNLFLASGGRRFAELRAQCMASSDQAVLLLDTWLERRESRDGMSGGARFYTRVAIALQALAGLPEIRRGVAALALTPTRASEQYSQLVATLLALVFEAADVAIDPAISRLLIALFHLMQGKESAGRERATGAAAFAAGRIGEAEVQAIEYLIEMQENSFRHFVAFCDELGAEWRALQSLLPLSSLERLRRKLLSGLGRPLDSALADEWYTCCSARMDELHRVENHLAGLLQGLCRQRIEQLQRDSADQQQRLSELRESLPLPPQAAFAAGIGGPVAAAGDGIGPHLTQAVVDMLQSQSQRLQSLTDELATVRANLEERKLIERAKGILMATQGLDEAAAYRLLRQNAMNQNRRLADVAEALLGVAGLLPAQAGLER
jgi:hypothetical protein